MERKKKLTGALAAMCFVMALVLALSSVGATLAKYVRQDASTGAAVAAPFYFSSDTLDENGSYYPVSEPKAGETVEIVFTLQNYVDDLRCTAEAITYSYWAVTGQDASGEKIAGTEVSGRLDAGAQNTNTHKMALTGDNFGSEGVVTVVAQSQSPYARTLTARFSYNPQTYSLQYTVSEQSGAVVLEIAGGSGKNVTVTWPSGLSPDRSNAVFTNASGNSTTFVAEEGVRYALTFLKSDPDAQFTRDQFDVTEASA